MNNCLQCGRKLTPDEKSLYKKLVNRTASEFMCISCLSKFFKVSEELLQEKLEYFKNSGCTLF